MYEIKFDEYADASDFVDASCMNLGDIVSQDGAINLVVFMRNNKNVLKKYVRKFIKYRRVLAKAEKCNIYVKNYDGSRLQKDCIKLIESTFLVDIRKIYEQAYDIACDYLDSQFYGRNLCDFCDNKCGYRKDTDIEVGCCRHFTKHKQFGAMFGEKLIPCTNLGKDGKCQIKCMGCKLFTCDYLENKGVRFRTSEILAIDSVFSPLQRAFLKAIVYTPKDKVINTMMFLS